MLLKGPGKYHIRCVEVCEYLYATATAPGPALVCVDRISGDGQTKREEDCTHIGAGSPHTWWNVNPLFVPQLTLGEEVDIQLDGTCVLRLEQPGLEVVE